MQAIAEEAATKAIEPLQDIEVPNQLGRLIDGHKKTLIGLASSLLSGGQSEANVQRVLDRVFESFKSDLMDAILKLKENEDAL